MTHQFGNLSKIANIDSTRVHQLSKAFTINRCYRAIKRALHKLWQLVRDQELRHLEVH